MIKKLLFSLKKKDDKIVNTVAQSFEQNKRLSSILNEDSTGYRKGLHLLISYAYLLVKKLDGVYSSKNGSSHIFYYRSSQLKRSLLDRIRYVYLAVFSIGLGRASEILKRERQVKQIRTQDQQKNNHRDFLYVWFLAQAKSYNALDALMEMKRFIMDKADLLNIPIYMETTEFRLVPLYARMGFKFYDSHVESDYTIYFAKYEPFLYKMSQNSLHEPDSI